MSLPDADPATATEPVPEATSTPAPKLTITEGDRVVVSGSGGFIGSAVVRALARRGADVVALVSPGGDERNLAGLDVEIVTADVRDAESISTACKGARFVFHLAALYRFWARRPGDFYDVNVGGTLNVVDAVRKNDCERLVYTSTVGVLGLDGAARGLAADETCYADISHLFGSYKRTKYVAEHEVLRAAAQGAPVSIVLPTFPLGPCDRKPTPTGRVVLDFLNGRMPGYVDTTFNVQHVDDLADGHLRALEFGRVGRSYIVGGDNVPMGAFLRELAQRTGLPAPSLRVPRVVALSVGGLSDVVEGKLLRREPKVPFEAARMSTTNMMFSDRRAREELGHRSRPLREAIVDSARWFLENGYVNAKRAACVQLD